MRVQDVERMMDVVLAEIVRETRGDLRWRARLLNVAQDAWATSSKEAKQHIAYDLRWEGVRVKALADMMRVHRHTIRAWLDGYSARYGLPNPPRIVPLKARKVPQA